MSEFPLSPIDRKIDGLGAETSILSETNATDYVDALLGKFSLGEKQLPGLASLKDRLARAEFTAVRHPEKGIPESRLGQAFNEMMDEFRMPGWTRVSPEELHAFRAMTALALYPKSTPRLANGNLRPTCRPVEALYLIYLLHANMGVQPELREVVRAGRWPATDPRALPSQGPLQLGFLPRNSATARRLREYHAALNAFLTAHPGFNFQDEVEMLFDRLGIAR
ncbi:MAG TPA: hypothetical protein VFW94_18080 [Candidatus Acidoferrales bacterium]|nr:hypothetical protein [Candidatus Acidoferrales bacterium]